jgi:hypothetical protein
MVVLTVELAGARSAAVNEDQLVQPVAQLGMKSGKRPVERTLAHTRRTAQDHKPSG